MTRDLIKKLLRNQLKLVEFNENERLGTKKNKIILGPLKTYMIVNFKIREIS